MFLVKTRIPPICNRRKDLIIKCNFGVSLFAFCLCGCTFEADLGVSFM